MKNYLFIDSPECYQVDAKFFSEGSSPKILCEFLAFISSRRDVIDSIYLCLYLYNNKILHDELLKLSEFGVKVNIISIPLEGYDDTNPKNIYNVNNPVTPAFTGQTKRSLAQKIYSEMRSTYNDFFKLYIFPHISIRSSRVKPFSRGMMPYSLHGKSIYIKYKDGSGAIGLTSSNLAVRDMIKDEIMVISESNVIFNKMAQHFFNSLITNSILINEFDETTQYLDYQINLSPEAASHPQMIYTAPFYNDFQTKAKRSLLTLMNSAKERIFVCAQHICEEDILKAVIAKSENGVEIKCLSQTFVDASGNSHYCRRPVNSRAFRDFIREYEKHSNCMYAVNDSVHSKFMVVDDDAILTTCNLTPTQFIYNGNVNIPKFDNIPNVSYHGIHSEVGQFLILKDEEICDLLIKHFENIWNREDTHHHIVKICKKCGSSMKERNGPYGDFFGCESFPVCRHTERK